MSASIIPIERIKEAAEAAVASGSTDCPPEWLPYETVWIYECRAAEHEAAKRKKAEEQAGAQ